MEVELVCECGHKRFYVSSDGKVAKCSKCGTIYDRTGTALKTIESDAPSVTIDASKNTSKIRSYGEIHNAKEKV